MQLLASSMQGPQSLAALARAPRQIDFASLAHELQGNLVDWMMV